MLSAVAKKDQHPTVEEDELYEKEDNKQ